ncbi:hypothetical protein MNBD_GAMMA10-372 [hydrothermal vent metagenome]|uniref:Uncharacterized protein n=1 Tax=hydrothermal vent metagenome TaxID=652676 RepID=A0A3B0YTV4_9ZZZZ
MKELLQAYDQLVAKHESRLQRLEDNEYLISYAAHDFFSIEPFYHEMNSIPTSQAKFYAHMEELPEDGYTYICAIVNHKLAYVRNAFGPDTYYDSFFSYDNNETWRLEIYVNEQGKKPVKVERLIRDENGANVSFETYSEHGYQKFDYKYTPTGLNISAAYFDSKHNHHMDRQFQVLIDYTDNSVESILEIENTSHTLIYDKTLANAPIEDLLKHVQSSIVQTILTELEKSHEIESQIDYMLLEYTMQHPFPPTFALDSQPVLNEGDYPLGMYNAPDMQYFSEEDLVVDFDNDSVLYDSINSQLNALYDDSDEAYEQTANRVFNAYAEICRELNKRMPKFVKKIKLSDEFHVLARDFEQCNELDFIKVLFTEEKIKAIELSLEAYEKKSVLNEEDQATLERLEKTLHEQGEKYTHLKQILQEKTTSSVYTTELVYYLNPFGYEFHNYKANYKAGTAINFNNQNDFSVTPPGDSYYEYIIENGELTCIANYQNGEIRTEQFYLREESLVSEWLFQYYTSGLELNQFSTLVLKNKKADMYETYQYKHIETTTYKYDAHGNIISDEDVRCLIDKKFIHKAYSEHTYSYTNEHELQKITHIFDDGKKSNTVFCTDDSFMQECITSIVKLCHDNIMENISEHNIRHTIRGALAIVLEIDRAPIFPLHYFYILLPGMQSSIHWERVDIGYNDSMEDNLYLNFSVYTSTSSSLNEPMYFTAKEAKLYIKRTLTDITEKLQRSVNEKFDTDIQVHIKQVTESTEKLDQIIIEKHNSE